MQELSTEGMSEDEIEELESIDNVFVGINSMKKNTTKNPKRIRLKKKQDRMLKMRSLVMMKA